MSGPARSAASLTNCRWLLRSCAQAAYEAHRDAAGVPMFNDMTTSVSCAVYLLLDQSVQPPTDVIARQEQDGCTGMHSSSTRSTHLRDRGADLVVLD
jgi:hypothetical protein